MWAFDAVVHLLQGPTGFYHLPFSKKQSNDSDLVFCPENCCLLELDQFFWTVLFKLWGCLCGENPTFSTFRQGDFIWHGLSTWWHAPKMSHIKTLNVYMCTEEYFSSSEVRA